MDGMLIFRLVVLGLVVALVYGLPFVLRGRVKPRDAASADLLIRRLDYVFTGGVVIFGLGALLFGRVEVGIGAIVGGVGLFVWWTIQRRFRERARPRE